MSDGDISYDEDRWDLENLGLGELGDLTDQKDLPDLPPEIEFEEFDDEEDDNDDDDGSETRPERMWKPLIPFLVARLGMHAYSTCDENSAQISADPDQCTARLTKDYYEDEKKQKLRCFKRQCRNKISTLQGNIAEYTPYCYRHLRFVERRAEEQIGIEGDKNNTEFQDAVQGHITRIKFTSVPGARDFSEQGQETGGSLLEQIEGVLTDSNQRYKLILKHCLDYANMQRTRLREMYALMDQSIARARQLLQKPAIQRVDDFTDLQVVVTDIERALDNARKTQTNMDEALDTFAILAQNEELDLRFDE